MITICLTEDEIMNLPNDALLGEVVRLKYWKEKKTQEIYEDNQESEDGRNQEIE